MDFEVGILYGEDYQFSKNRAWPRVKLAVDHDRLVLATGFESYIFPRAQITRIAEFHEFTWLHAEALQIEHTVNPEEIPIFIVVWTFSLAAIKRALEENNYSVTAVEKQPRRF